MESNKELVKYLTEKWFLKTERIIKAFKAVKRKDFVIAEFREFSYENKALPTLSDQTISQPATVAFMLELLSPQVWDKILHIGFWSWWTSALLAFIVGRGGDIRSYERQEQVYNFGKKNIARYRFKQISTFLWEEDFSLIPWSFDKILVSASASDIPKELIYKLKPKGRIIIPIEHSIWSITRENEQDIQIKKYFWFSFVPLVYKKEDVWE